MSNSDYWEVSGWDETEDEKAWRKAKRDMERAHLLTMPTPEEIAFTLPLELASELVHAHQVRDGWAVRDRFRDELFSRGLVGARTNRLGAFGMAVRRILKEEMKG